MSSTPEPDAGEELMLAIQRLGRLMGSRQVSSRIAEAAGAEISQQGVQILRALLRHGEQTIAGLAAAAHMDISAVSRQLRPLEQGELVRRSSAAGDGRVALVALSPTGRKVAKRIRQVGLRHLSESLADWSDDDRAELGRLMTRLVDDLQRTSIAPPGR
jgi:DNA-binding MarR family transcriptional regulator